MSRTETRLRLSRIFRAPRQKVFDAWTKPELMRLWFCPQELVVSDLESDTRVGGRYRIAMKDETRDKVFTTVGVFKEIQPNRKLVFTWGFDQPGQTESLVTVTFDDKAGGTEVTVLHERYADMAGESTHEQGWTSALENLARRVFDEK